MFGSDTVKWIANFKLTDAEFIEAAWSKLKKNKTKEQEDASSKVVPLQVIPLAVYTENSTIPQNKETIETSGMDAPPVNSKITKDAP